MANQENEPVSKIPDSFQSFVHKPTADSLPLVFGQNRKRSEYDHVLLAISLDEPGFAQEQMSDDFSVPFRHNGQFGYKRRRLANFLDQPRFKIPISKGSVI